METEAMSAGVNVAWCRDKAAAANAAKFMAANVEPSQYASPSDYLSGRMNQGMMEWASDFEDMLVSQFEDIVDDNEHRKLAIAKIDEEIVAIAIVVVVVSVRGGYGAIEDFVVRSDCRQQGIGKYFLGWIETSLLRRGIHHVFIEVTSKNQVPLIFCTSLGYNVCGIQMHRELSVDERAVDTKK